MPKFTFNDSDARKPYEEPGDYRVSVENFEWKISTAGNDILVLKLRTDDGALVYDNLVFTENAYWKIDHALKAFLPSKGKTPPKKGENFNMNNDWVEENLHGATGWVNLSKGTTPSGKIRNEVQAYLPPDPNRKAKPPTQGTTTNPAPATTSAKPNKPTPAKAAPAKATAPDDDEIPF